MVMRRSLRRLRQLAREVGLFRVLYRRARLAWWSSVGRGSIIYPMGNGEDFHLPLDKALGIDLFCMKRSMDWGAEGLLIRYLGTIPRGTFIDVGANIGYYSRLLAGHFERGIAFEPDARNWGKLVRNLPEHFKLEKVAVGERSGTAMLDVSGSSCGSHLSTAPALRSATQVELVSLDDYIESRPPSSPVTCIKMDIEGHELPALVGARSLIAKCRPVLLIEYNVDEQASNTWQGLRDLTSGWDYDIFAMVEVSRPWQRFVRALARIDVKDLGVIPIKMVFLVPVECSFFSEMVELGFRHGAGSTL
jgi:FkbM family methyltransferase